MPLVLLAFESSPRKLLRLQPVVLDRGPSKHKGVNPIFIINHLIFPVISFRNISRSLSFSKNILQMIPTAHHMINPTPKFYSRRSRHLLCLQHPIPIVNPFNDKNWIDPFLKLKRFLPPASTSSSSKTISADNLRATCVLRP